MKSSDEKITQTANDWTTTEAWVSWYGRAGYGEPFTEYHPSPSKTYGPGNCRLKTTETENGMKINVIAATPSNDLKAWPDQAKLLLEAANFELTGVVMSSQIIDIKATLKTVYNPFEGKFSHVKFDVTKDVQDGEKVFTTHAIWYPEQANIKNMAGIIRTTSYPWKDH